MLQSFYYSLTLVSIQLYHWTISEVDMGPERFGTHHSKMIILFYPNGVRICIMTANFTESDFEYLTQGVYVADFPLLSSANSENMSPSIAPDIRDSEFGVEEFKKPLVDYLKHVYPMGQEARYALRSHINSLDLYDFRNAQVALVPSVPGIQ
jgi:tyrosyl-DNA phosphodiesterase-1